MFLVWPGAVHAPIQVKLNPQLSVFHATIDSCQISTWLVDVRENGNRNTCFFTYHSVDGHMPMGLGPSIIVRWYVITGSTLLCVSRTLAGPAWNKCNIRLLSIMTGVNRSLQRRRSVDSLLQFSSIFLRRQTQAAVLCWPTTALKPLAANSERNDISWQMSCRMPWHLMNMKYIGFTKNSYSKRYDDLSTHTSILKYV